MKNKWKSWWSYWRLNILTFAKSWITSTTTGLKSSKNAIRPIICSRVTNTLGLIVALLSIKVSSKYSNCYLFSLYTIQRNECNRKSSLWFDLNRIYKSEIAKNPGPYRSGICSHHWEREEARLWLWGGRRERHTGKMHIWVSQ